MQNKIEKTIRLILQKIENKKKPISTEAKHNLIVELLGYYDSAQEMYEAAKWIQALVLYKIDELNLYNYFEGRQVSKNSFYASQDIAPSTARSRRDMWVFYAKKHKIPIKLLMSADTHKLFRAIKVLKDKPTKEVIEAVLYAKRKLVSRSDFYKELGIK